MPARIYATKIVEKLQDAGHTAYFAGGWVRDYFMQRRSDDIDIATSATVKEIQTLFPHTIPVGIAFGIVIVVEEGIHFEVATFRKDHGYKDGRRPTGIDLAAPEEDAQRRDFTINGLFYDPIKDKLWDYVEGLKDLERGIIRAIGDPHARFAEDRLRMMRAVRYATRFGFPIEEETEKAIKIHAKELLPAVAMERIWQEFKKMSHFAHFDKGLIKLHALGLLPVIFPELQSVSTAEIEKRVAYIEKFPKPPPTFAEMLELFPNYDLNQTLELCDYLKLSNQEKQFTHFYHRAKNLLKMPESWLKQLELAEWADFYADPACTLCLSIFACHLPLEKEAAFLQEHQTRQTSLHDAIQRMRSHHPIVNAEALIREGVQPGPKMGKLLKEAERIAINHQLVSPKEIIQKLKETSLWSS